MRAALTTIWILSGALLLGSVSSGAEIAPTTGQVDKDGNEILEGDDTPAAKTSEPKGPKKRARPKSRFEEKAKGVSLPEEGEDLQDDGGAADVPLPTHPLLRRAVLNRQRGTSEAEGGAVVAEGAETAPAASATQGAQASSDSESRPWLILVGVLVLFAAGGGWLYRQYSLGRPDFSKLKKTTR